VFDERQSFSVDFRRNVDDFDEEDVRDVVRCASPPVATRQHVAVNENLPRSNVLMYSQETEVL